MDEKEPIEVARQIADLAMTTGHAHKTLNIAKEIVHIRDAAEGRREYAQRVKELEEAGYPV